MMLKNGLTKEKLIMVDLDGTLIDTLEANYRSYKRALNEFGYDITKDYYARRCDGRSYKDFLPEIIGENNPDISVIHSKKNTYYVENMKYTTINIHLKNILESMKAEYYIALVTTASRESVNSILEYFKLTNIFDAVVTREDVGFSKPNPECYIKTRERFGVSRANTIIFEDSESGMCAAMESGCSMFCYKKSVFM